MPKTKLLILGVISVWLVLASFVVVETVKTYKQDQMEQSAKIANTEPNDKETNPSSDCPEWINCMPSIDGPRENCSETYLKKVKESCPNFKGIAY